MRCRVQCSMSRGMLLRCCYRSLSTLGLPLQDNPRTNLLQCNKQIQELWRLGRADYARKLFDEMIQRDAVTWNTMISGYSQNGRLDEARVFFDTFAGKNVRTWTAMLTGYAKHGQIEEARWVFESMPERNIVAWNAMVSGYVQNGDLYNARRVFDEMPERNVASWNSIVTGYCRCGLMGEARELFDQMHERNPVSWMVMISGYAEINGFNEAWDVFVRMHRSDFRPDQSIFVVAISAVTGLNDFELIGNLRTLAMKTGHERDIVVGTAILNVYTRSGCLDDAVQFFELMPERNEYSWTSMIAAFSQCERFNDAIALYNRVPKKGVSTQTAIMTAYAQSGRIGEARRIFNEIPTPYVIAWNAMVAGYAQNGMLEEAKALFLQMPIRNSASWAAMIAGLVHNGRSKEALELLAELHRSGAVPSHSSFTSALSACANNGAIEMGKQIHSLSIKAGCQFNSYVGNGLISMYAKCKNIEDVSQVFSRMRQRDTVSWNSLITGLSENCLLDDARNTFEKMSKRDVVSWSAIISAYVQAGHGEVALQLFLDMNAHGIRPNELSVTSILSTCGSLGSAKLGEQLHALIHKFGFDSFTCVGNSLVTMYFKCGFEDGFTVFEEMGEQDIVTWNAILAGCAQNGFGNEAVKIFEKMKAKGIAPDQISFLGLLCACSHSGLVDEGLGYFNSMIRDYGIMPQIHHYTCMVDLLGRAGRFSEAESLIEKMPMEPDLVIWDALLAACRIHCNTELGQRVAERLIQMGTQKYGPYVLLANLYASQGMRDKVGEVQKLMFNRGVSKEPGLSWIQIKSELHYFLTGDKTNKLIKEIQSVLKEFYGNFQASGCVPSPNFVLHDTEEEQNQNELLYHSEKLAVTFGILNTPNGTPIRIMKNLRICGDCHNFVKYMSKVTRRKIVIQNGNRFHHFCEDSCSCRNYW
ncbi:pentatricopeptide repeat-containing protein At4g02750-like [Actinidia eriantha]|uniref:pentatricopeptide repeat-containing protein At4g02750-like n=1 Tax=Actinidia eriantha TaxID=165200 RepID=UPI00258AAFFC|nr:pentatricopeptide repeat-containing protein At4g02750-like [Actinidia eriantha]XP_057471612.1 pentatricopeptide repeat-containing protein At4g02750-like [Actinidia eriantha]XP_057471613.1 pentatricopeptide repeat-containing protein At4g02750-like [Actinidia eriantha]XP_057471614.1 pentatricopeptide repeat-containing protein At4g02750-like [Actinidia eriantha]XP_057471615.1 pentatricopeptide repeat-containing protein At4g02750-like [Actinidia eriantha]XP_057471616.1 pentatricopeptide repeat-